MSNTIQSTTPNVWYHHIYIWYLDHPTHPFTLVNAKQPSCWVNSFWQDYSRTKVGSQLSGEFWLTEASSDIKQKRRSRVIFGFQLYTVRPLSAYFLNSELMQRNHFWWEGFCACVIALLRARAQWRSGRVLTACILGGSIHSNLLRRLALSSLSVCRYYIPPAMMASKAVNSSYESSHLCYHGLQCMKPDRLGTPLEVISPAEGR